MSNETEREINQQTRAQKLLKAEITIFEDGTTHLQCIHYREEGPHGKLFPWRVDPDEFLTLSRDSISNYSSYITTYDDVGLDPDKPSKIGKITLMIDTNFVVDPDYVSYEEFGPNNKRRPTRPGYTEFKRVISMQIGPNLLARIFGEGEDVA
jgi:hypothetical protein